MKISEVDASATPTGANHHPSESPPRLIRFDPTEPEPDVKEMMDKSAMRLSALNARLRVLNWACRAFNGDNSLCDPAMWQQFLSEAMSPGPDDEEGVMFETTRAGPGILAAVCVRDHWEEMSALQRGWCIGRVCMEVMAGANQWNSVERVQRDSMAADRPCAWVLSLLLGKSMLQVQRTSVQEAFAVAVTHPITEVRWHAVCGIAQNLLSTDRPLAMHSVNALAKEATLIEAGREAQDAQHAESNIIHVLLGGGMPHSERRRQVSEIAAEAANAARNAFWEPDGIPSSAYEKLDVEKWFGADANAQILTILSKDLDNPAIVSAFIRAAQTVVKWWDENDHRRLEKKRLEHNHDSETAITKCIQSFVMQTSYESAKFILKPILGAIDNHPHEIHSIIEGLTVIEDGTPNTPHYWRLWELFSDAVKRAKWVSALNDDHPFGSEMLSAIFLTSWWKENVRHWRSLNGHSHHVHAVFEALPPSWIVLDSYVRFLYHIGEESLPEAFSGVANALKAGDAHTMLADANTVLLLEVLLQRHVYGRPLELKRQPTVRNAVVYLLDTLVENGSPAAFRMRDDFVTPALV